MNEIWKYIPWYEWLYMVSDLWRVKSLLFNKEKILIPQYTKSWYQKVWLYVDCNYSTHRVHRLVMQAFLWFSELEVNHRNSIRDDNRLENLEYVTREENTLHRISNNKKERCTCCNQILKKSRN